MANNSRDIVCLECEKPRLEFFEADPNYRHMSKEEKSVLATACSVQNFAAGDVILREGEVGEWMFIVIEGTVKTVDPLSGSMSIRVVFPRLCRCLPQAESAGSSPPNFCERCWERPPKSSSAK